MYETPTEKGHGRIETRSIQASTALNEYLRDELGFPYVRQVFKLKREVFHASSKKETVEIVYGVTSLSEQKAKPQDLLKLNRGHWAIENKVHWVRDVTFDEDRSRIRKGNGPGVAAMLKNIAMNLLRMVGCKNISEGLRNCAWDYKQAFRMIGVQLS